MGSPLEYLDSMADGLKGALWVVLGPLLALFVGVALGEIAWTEGGFIPSHNLLWVLGGPFWVIFANLFCVAGWICLLVEIILLLSFWTNEERRRGVWFLLCMVFAVNAFVLESFVVERSGEFGHFVQRSHVIQIVYLLATGVVLLGCYLLLRFRYEISARFWRLLATRARRHRDKAEAENSQPHGE